MKASGSVLGFREKYSVEQRQKMFKNTQKNKPGCILVVVQKNNTCKRYSTLTSNLFTISREITIHMIKTELKKRLQLLMNQNLQKQALFLHTHKYLLNEGQKTGDIYALQKNQEDGILYLQYSSVDPFG